MEKGQHIRENSYTNVLGHDTGQYIMVRVHNSVHAELDTLEDATSTIHSFQHVHKVLYSKTILGVISSFLLTLPWLMVSSPAP